MKTGLIIAGCLTVCQSFAQTQIDLYRDGVPNLRKGVSTEENRVIGADGGQRISHVVKPALTAYFPIKPNGRAIIICPGGGYRRLSVTKEGHDVARLLSDSGTTAFVLKYRLPDDSLFENTRVVPLQDAQRAIQLVKAYSAQWHIDSSRIGLMGFSAGGHLASMAGVHWDTAFIPRIAGVSLKPAFLILVYPAISMTDSLALSKTQREARARLLGPNPSAKDIIFYSPELNINAASPPAFIVHTADDSVVHVNNSVRFYQQLVQYKVPAALHLYKKGGHGFGLVNREEPARWMDWLNEWLRKY